MSGFVKVKWKPQSRLSAVHAAYAVASGRPCADRKTEEALAPAVTEINQRLLSASLDVHAFWQRLMVEAAEDREDRSAIEIALVAAGCSELQLESIASAIHSHLRECRTVVQERFPKLAEQLVLRGRPLIERFDAYGPGLLRGVTDYVWDNCPPKDWWPPKYEGLLLQPILGGAGDYDAERERFWVEAILADVEPEVPEVLRVVYLITMATMGRHTRSKSGDSSHSIPWSLGLVPIVLKIGAGVGLVPGGELPVSLACRLWQVGDASTSREVAQWWRGFESDRQPLPVALKGLGQSIRKSRATTSPPPD